MPVGDQGKQGKRSAASTQRKPATLGMFFDGFPERQPGHVILGAHVAAEAFFRALLRHGRWDRYELFAPPWQEESARAQVGRLCTAAEITDRQVNVGPYRDLLRSFDEYDFTVWHDPGGIPTRPFHLRSIGAQRLFPITFIHYTISYQQMLHEFFLRNLLSDTAACDSVVCNTQSSCVAFKRLLEHVRDECDQAFGTRLEFKGRYDVIPIGVDTDVFRPRDKPDVRRHFELPADAFIILWLGRFSATDKTDLLPLVRVYRDLVKANPSRRLLFVMAGTERSSYGSAVADYATSLGLEDRLVVLRNIPGRYQHLLHAAADVFVSPSDNIQECFGLTPVEAMACGVPQVVADWDGYRDTVRHGETGFRVPTCWCHADQDLSAAAALFPWEYDHLRLAQSVAIDLTAYREYLQALLDNADLRNRMGEASRARAVTLYSWEAVIGQYESLWSDLAVAAAGEQMGASRRSAYSQPPYYRAFGHYASHRLADETPLVLTRAGSEVLRGKMSLPSFAGLFHCVEQDILREILVALKVSGRFGRRYRAGDLARDLSGRSADVDSVTRHILWLLKYGFVEPFGGFSALPPMGCECEASSNPR